MVEVLSERSFDPPAAAEELTTFLRRSTAKAHARLESALDLLAEPVTAVRFRTLLERFYGFHSAWEPSLAPAGLKDFQAARTRLPHLARDVAALGGAPLSDLATCLSAGALAATPASALGSAYVMEGSTLGGQLISRALEGRSWAPRGGLIYFNPYGVRTGEMWRRFRIWANGHPAGRDRNAVADGANRTFEALEAWLTH